MLHAQLAALMLAATTLAVSGCGKSSSTSTQSATSSTAGTTPATTPATPSSTTVAVAPAGGQPLTKARLIAKANSICRRANTQRDALTARTEPELARILSEGLAYDRGEASALGKLVPPAAMASDWQQLLTNLQAIVEDTKKTIPLLQSGISGNAQPFIQAGKEAQKHVAIIATHDGLTVCAGV